MHGGRRRNQFLFAVYLVEQGGNRQLVATVTRADNLRLWRGEKIRPGDAGRPDITLANQGRHRNRVR